jgi:hypothetical protein
MSRSTNLLEPWRALADKLGGAGQLYAALQPIPLSTAKRICRGTGQLNFNEWMIILNLFKDHGISL